jgi:hypothetical protein
MLGLHVYVGRSKALGIMVAVRVKLKRLGLEVN